MHIIGAFLHGSRDTKIHCDTENEILSTTKFIDSLRHGETEKVWIAGVLC